MLLTHRKLLQSKAIAIENDLRGTLRNFGLKVGMVGKVKFEVRIRELVENLPDLAVLVEPLLIVRRTLREQIVILHRRLLAIVRDDEVCRRLMTTPGVGPVVALTYRATVDVPRWPNTATENDAPNPWSKKHWNLTNQARLYNRDRAEADRLARAAGHRDALSARIANAK